MRKMFTTFITILIVISIVFSNFNLIFALEPPIYFIAESIEELVDWIKTSDDSLYESFLNNVRQHDELLTVKENSRFSLTEIRVENYNDDEMIYIFDDNSNRLLFHIYLPDENRQDADLEDVIADRNKEYESEYDNLQYNSETVNINETETKIYYVNGGKYISKTSGEEKSKQLHALFDYNGYQVSIMGGYAMNQAAWDSSYLELFNFQFVDIQESKGMRGDINNDKVINAEDALAVLKHSARILGLQENDIEFADADGDKDIDATDALFILKYAANIIDSFPVDDNNEKPNDVPPLLREVSYSTYEDLKSGILNDYNDDKLNEIESLESNDSKGAFKEFISNRKNSNEIYVPYYNGQVMELRNEEGYYNTVLVPESVGNQPTIGFYTKHNGNVLTIFTTYLDTLASEETLSMADENGLEWLYSQLDPEIKISELIPDYKEHYVKELQLKNRTIDVIYVEYNYASKEKIYITFPYDGVLVRIFGNREAVEDWLKGADFKPVALKQ